jgi:hypothetical protein
MLSLAVFLQKEKTEKYAHFQSFKALFYCKKSLIEGLFQMLILLNNGEDFGDIKF